jgi:hypothetical protein
MVRRVSAAVACAVIALACLAGSVTAQSITFGTPSAKSTFGTSIVFTQPYSGGQIKSANLLVETPGDVGPSVIPVVRPGSTSLTSTLDTSGGGMFPNTPVVAHFEVVLDDGTTLSGPDIHVTYADDRFTWKTKTGKIVRLHWIQATDAFAQQLLTWAENGVVKAAAMFGVAETKPIDYFVYPSQDVFQQGLNEPGTVGGVALPSFRTCFALVAPGDSKYGAEVLPHEVTHIVFDDAVNNPYHHPPRWLDEGFAVYLSIGYDAEYRQLVTQAVKAGTLTSILALSDYFPMDSTRIYLAYAEAVSAVDFMVRKYGQPAVQKLVQAYAGGVSDDEAFTTGIGVDVAGFNDAWLADNGVTSTKYGPQPAPTGPLPSGWNGSSAGSSAQPQASGSGGPAVSPTTPGGSQQPKGSNVVVLVLAALLAAAGFTMVALSYVLISQARR